MMYRNRSSELTIFEYQMLGAIVYCRGRNQVCCHVTHIFLLKYICICVSTNAACTLRNFKRDHQFRPEVVVYLGNVSIGISPFVHALITTDPIRHFI